MKNKTIILTVLMLVFNSVVFAVQKEDRTMIKGLRPMSMGGAFTAISDDENVFFYNPAGITRRHDCLTQFSFIDIAVNREIIDSYLNNKEDFNSFCERQSNRLSLLNLNDKEDFNDFCKHRGDFISKMAFHMLNNMGYVFVSVPNILFISKPLYISQSSLSFGLGVFSCADLNFRFDSLLSLSYKAEGALVGVLPIAFKINPLKVLPGSLSLGASFKYMYKIKSFADKIYNFNDFKESVIIGGGSFGIDLGAIYNLGSCWNFGLSMSDIYNSGIEYKKLDLVSLKFLESYSEAKIDPKLNFGVAYYPEKFYYWFGKYWELDDRMVFAFDLTDLMNPNEPFADTALKRSHIGAEYKFGPFVVRAGINSGYLTLGGGLISDIINIEYAFYGEERGIYTNRNPLWFHRILFSYRI